jgi:hypothetical protein
MQAQEPKLVKEWEELLRNTAEQEMKTELGKGKRPRKQAQYSFERHIQVYVEEDEVDNDPYCSAASSSSSDSDSSVSCTLPSIRCCCSSKTCLVGREALQEHERTIHEQASQELLRRVGRREGMGGGGSVFWSGAARENVRAHFPKCFAILLSKQFVAIAPCSFVLEFCTRTL